MASEEGRWGSSRLARVSCTLVPPALLVCAPHGPGQQQPEPPDCWPLPPPPLLPQQPLPLLLPPPQLLPPPLLMLQQLLLQQLLPPPLLQQPELWCRRRRDRRGRWWLRQQPPPPELQQPPELEPQQEDTGGHLGGHFGDWHLGGGWHCFWLCWLDIFEGKSVNLRRNGRDGRDGKTAAQLSSHSVLPGDAHSDTRFFVIYKLNVETNMQ